MVSQKAELLARLRQGPIMPMEALSDLGIMALSQRITGLRDDGHIIDTELVEVTKRNGSKARVARYTLIQEAKAAA